MVEVLHRDISVAVRTDQTLLEALLDADVEMIYDRQRGECGLCAVSIVQKNKPVDHRDVFFSNAGKHEDSCMCACVSRLAGDRATIDVVYRGRVPAMIEEGRPPPPKDLAGSQSPVCPEPRAMA